MRISASTSCSRPRLAVAALGVSLAVLVASCVPIRAARHEGGKDIVVASWYGPQFHGNLTASGEVYDMDAMTCAHRTLPFGTRLSLTNVANGQEAAVTVNDRGPFVRGRSLDLSRAAARKLGMIGAGTGTLAVTILDRDHRYEKYLGGRTIQRTVGPSGVPYTVQVGAYTLVENADHIRQGLELNYGEVYVMEKWRDGVRYYRVRLGRFPSIENAAELARRLAEEGYEVAVVPYEGEGS